GRPRLDRRRSLRGRGPLPLEGALMSRFRASRSQSSDPAMPGEKQHTILERLEGIARAAQVIDASRPALLLFGVVLALLALGLVIQASHAATTSTPEVFWSVLWSQLLLRTPP